VWWGWHSVDAGAVANAVQSFQHWAIRVRFDGDDDIWFENFNSGAAATGKAYSARTLTHGQVQQELVTRNRTAPFKMKHLGKTSSSKAQILAWIEDYKRGRTYNLAASLTGLATISEAQMTGNCQCLVWHLAGKMGVLTSDLYNSNYGGHDILWIPKPGRARDQCSVVAGSCTGSLTPFFGGYDSEWCGRCGHWYCPYHAPASETYQVAGGCHTCYSG